MFEVDFLNFDTVGLETMFTFVTIEWKVVFLRKNVNSTFFHFFIIRPFKRFDYYSDGIVHAVYELIEKYAFIDQYLKCDL